VTPAARADAAGLAGEAAVALGGQTALGALLGVGWLFLAPRPPARWTGLFWLSATRPGFAAEQAVWFGLLTMGAGIAVGVALTAWSGRPRPWRRMGLWLGGAVLGSATALATGLALGSGFASRVVEVETRAPLTLTAPGLVAGWAFAAALVPMLALAFRAWFGRTW
jgi:hypothetical protein